MQPYLKLSGLASQMIPIRDTNEKPLSRNNGVCTDDKSNECLYTYTCSLNLLRIVDFKRMNILWIESDPTFWSRRAGDPPLHGLIGLELAWRHTIHEGVLEDLNTLSEAP